MPLHTLFEKPVDRVIEGVIKADDKADLQHELEEYVITNEVGKRLEAFLDAYLNYSGANGVWVSGFFGSGKSHLLKMLALLLENTTFDQQGNKSALSIFLDKPLCRDNGVFSGNLKRAVAIPSNSILFNIDQKADVISKKELDAVLAVFVKVFDEHCGYYGKQGYIAQFEREMDADQLFAPFKATFKTQTGKEWDWARARAKRMGKEIDAAYQSTTGQDSSGILDQYRADYRLSIEDFAEQVQRYISQQEANFRLNFFVDEVGQYVADNVKLMTNLQTIAESLATKCQGQAWIIVTAQEDMQSVIGDVSQQAGNDFSKIQARFSNRMKLTSQDVAEVIQHRLLQKTAAAKPQLEALYQQQTHNFKTLFDFADASRNYPNFRNEEHFTTSYPFIPYQFDLFQAAIQGLSLHNAFEGKHSSVGERSMLGVFQQVAISIKDYDLGQLATFDLMYEGINKALKTKIQQSILKAENQFANNFAVKLLKALFLVKYIKEFKPTLRNMSVLMYNRFDNDLQQLNTQVEEGLKLLEKETYIQRNGELYEYLTDEEQDIEQEIKSTHVDHDAISSELEKLLYDGVIKTRKIRWDTNKQDYPYSRRLDDTLVGREYELGITIITPFHEHSDKLEKHRMDTVYNHQLVIVLPNNAQLMTDLLMYKRTEKYISHETRTTQQDSVQRILDEKARQNNERLNQLKNQCYRLLAEAQFFVGGHEQNLGGEDGQHKVFKAFANLIESTYPHLSMLRDAIYKEGDIKELLKPGGLFNGGDVLLESEQELLSFIQGEERSAMRTTFKALVQNFEKMPYGWPLVAIQYTLASLCKRGKVELRESTNVLDDAELANALLNTARHDKLILSPQVEFNARQIAQAKAFYNDFFDQRCKATEAKLIAKEIKQGFTDLCDALQPLQAQVKQLPFLQVLVPIITKLEETKAKPYMWFMTELMQQQDDWFDDKDEVIEPVQGFMKGHSKEIYLQAQHTLHDQQANLTYLHNDSAEQVKQSLHNPLIYQGSHIQTLKSQLATLNQQLDALISSERQIAQDKLTELEQKTTTSPNFKALDEAQQKQLTHPFSQYQQSLENIKLVAQLRESVNRFKDNDYQRLINNLRDWSKPQPKPVATPTPVKPTDNTSEVSVTPSSTETPNPTPVAAEEPPTPSIQSISLKEIEIDYSGLWLETEQDVEAYIAAYKRALQQHLALGKHIQL